MILKDILKSKSGNSIPFWLQRSISWDHGCLGNQSVFHKELASAQLSPLPEVRKQVSSSPPRDLYPVLLLWGVCNQNRPRLWALGRAHVKGTAGKAVFPQFRGNGLSLPQGFWGLDVRGNERTWEVWKCVCRQLPAALGAEHRHQGPSGNVLFWLTGAIPDCQDPKCGWTGRRLWSFKR